MVEVVCSEQMKKYFDTLESQASICYDIARKARVKGYDPETDVEIPFSEDLASSVEQLLNIQGVANKIRVLSKKYSREEVSLLIAKEVAKDTSKPKEVLLDQAIRVGLAVLTEGKSCAPLEGVTNVKILKNTDGSTCASVSFAGPVRSAGGTAQALSVLIADVVRRELGIDRYVPTRSEIARYVEEIPLYKQLAHLQYLPTKDEIELIVGNCPVCIDGEGTEEEEVSGYRDLARVETNRIRGGACLIIAEGLCQKAPKIQKHVKKLGIDGWDFLDKLISKRGVAEEDVTNTKLEPNYAYLKEILAGRPILSHPSRKGGFRLRYGRCRTTGLAALALHPAAMYIVDEFIAVGTQIKIERPGKAGAVTPCDSIEPPIVLLQNGDLIEVNDVNEAKTIKTKVKTIVDLGEILISYGEFAENNHVLVPGAYCAEWWLATLERKCPDIPKEYLNPSPKLAFEISEKYDVPLHPTYNLFWDDLTSDNIQILSEFVERNARLIENKLHIPKELKIKEILIELGALHIERDNEIILERYAYPLLRCLGLNLNAQNEILRVKALELKNISPLEYVSKLSGVKIQARAPTRIGAKMARPEKAGIREMTPPPHVLFPLGEEGGSQRLVNDAISAKEISVELGVRYCSECGKKGFMAKCKCGGHTEAYGLPITQKIRMDALIEASAHNIEDSKIPSIKGVRGLVSKNKTPEPLEKGILRAKHDIYVFKDGTVRFDMTDVPLTHFKPVELGLSVEQVKALGYEVDYLDMPLENEHQILELKPQDIIPSKNCGEYLVQVSKFIDELLVKFYKLEPFYRAERPEDLLGHLVIGLSPHTSGGILARIIGYTEAQVGYAHPFYHAAKRRNCDGDEDCVILLLDGLINFSRAFLPEKRGGQMDAPLVLSLRIDPNEIDKEAHNIDVCRKYPLEFYELTAKFAHPKEMETLIENVGKRIGTTLQYEGFGFTHDTTSISAGPTVTKYKRLKDMSEKIDAQLQLHTKIRAVDANDAAARLITHHFLPDLIGNLKKFSSQSVRCTKCNRKYRRIPLKGMCECGGNLTLTVHEKSVKKYLDIAKHISEKYGVSNYLQQRIALIEASISSTFESDKVRKCKLEEFM